MSKTSDSGARMPDRKQSGKVFPVLIIAVLALVAGVIAFSMFGARPNTKSALGKNPALAADQQDQVTALADLQSTLNTSLALPLDFRRVPDFELQDVNGQLITETIFDKQWSLVFFGYTHCPDVCPITLHVMKNVVEKLVEINKTPPQIVFVTVDPVRDTSEVLKKYVAYFNEEFIGITGDMNSVHKMTRSLGIVASFTANDTDPDNYLVDHTASLLLIDPQRRVRAKVSPPHEMDAIVADYLTLIAAPS